MSGIKYDSEKPQLDLIPAEAIIELGKVLTFGQKKYGRANWANGIEASRLLSAALRHLQQFNSGEDLDPESGLSHVSHAMCNLAFLTWMLQNRPELDNRWVKPLKEINEHVNKLSKNSFEGSLSGLAPCLHLSEIYCGPNTVKCAACGVYIVRKI